MTRSILISLVLLLSISIKAQEQIVIGEAFQIHSDILNEDRTYQVSLPTSYNSDYFYIEKSYPVMILLDGGRLFHLTSGIVHQMSLGSVEKIPEMIVIGVRNTDRNRDQRPVYEEDREGNIQENEAEGAGPFMAFLEKELIPEIEKKYRTSGVKVLVGHSFAGLFTVHAFVNHHNFDAWLAIDPSLWWEDEALVNQFKQMDQPLKGNLYISQGNNPFDPGIEKSRLGQAVQEFKRTLENKDHSNLNFHFDFFEKEDHFSIPLISLFNGLKELFRGYQFPLEEIKTSDATTIKEHYQALSVRFQGQLPPPGKLLNQVSMFLLNSENQVDKAIELLELNASFYPETYHAWFNLGTAYQRKGDRGKAIENYFKAKEIDPANERINRALEELNP